MARAPQYATFLLTLPCDDRRATAGRTFIFDAASGQALEVMLQYPELEEAAASLPDGGDPPRYPEHWIEPPPPQHQQRPSYGGSDGRHAASGQPEDGNGLESWSLTQALSGSGASFVQLDATPPVVDSGCLAALYPRFRCRMCGWRCSSKPELATHVSGHRADASPSGAASRTASTSLDELRSSYLSAPATLALGFQGLGPVAILGSASGSSIPLSRGWYPPA